VSTDIKIVNDLEEITAILDKFLKFKTKISITQENDGKEVSIEAEVKNVNVGSCEIYLRPTSGAQFDPDKVMVLTFNNGEGNMEFEAEPAGFMKKTLAKFHFPTSIKIDNLRMNDRIYFDDTEVNFSVELQGKGNFDVTLIDITSTGIGLRAKDGHEIFLQDDVLIINQLGSKKLDSPLMCKVVYCKDATSVANVDYYKVGVKFDKEIENLEEFVKDI
jgi:hypothetical protein